MATPRKAKVQNRCAVCGLLCPPSQASRRYCSSACQQFAYRVRLRGGPVASAAVEVARQRYVAAVEALGSYLAQQEGSGDEVYLDPIRTRLLGEASVSGMEIRRAVAGSLRRHDFIGPVERAIVAAKRYAAEDRP